MRKIETQTEREKKETRNKIVIGAVLVVIMILSTAGYAFWGKNKEQINTEKINYNGLDFTLSESGMWQTQIQDYTFTTKYNPLETENITISFLVSLQEYTNKPLFFVSDNRIAVNELSQNLAPFIERMQYACLKDRNCTENLPTKNCTSNVIITEYSNASKLYKEDNCTFIESDNEIMAADALLFKILGIRRF